MALMSFELREPSQTRYVSSWGVPGSRSIRQMVQRTSIIRLTANAHGRCNTCEPSQVSEGLLHKRIWLVEPSPLVDIGRLDGYPEKVLGQIYSVRWSRRRDSARRSCVGRRED